MTAAKAYLRGGTDHLLFAPELRHHEKERRRHDTRDYDDDHLVVAGALEDAGLRVIEPEPGERFDPALHSAPDTNGADADEDGGNLRILTVESPGVLLVTGNGEQPEVLIEASVTVGRINEHGQNG